MRKSFFAVVDIFMTPVGSFITGIILFRFDERGKPFLLPKFGRLMLKSPAIRKISYNFLGFLERFDKIFLELFSLFLWRSIQKTK